MLPRRSVITTHEFGTHEFGTVEFGTVEFGTVEFDHGAYYTVVRYGPYDSTQHDRLHPNCDRAEHDQWGAHHHIERTAVEYISPFAQHDDQWTDEQCAHLAAYGSIHDLAYVKWAAAQFTPHVQHADGAD